MPLVHPPPTARTWQEAVRAIALSLRSVIDDTASPVRWEDWDLLGTSPNPGGGIKPVTWITSEGQMCWDFTATSTTQLVGCGKMPHNAALSHIEVSGTAENVYIIPHAVIYRGGSTETGTASCVTLWELGYRWYNEQSVSQALSLTFTTVTFTTALTARQMEIITFPNISPSFTLAPSSIFKWRLARLGANATDTLNAGVRIDSFAAHYMVDVARGTRWVTEK